MRGALKVTYIDGAVEYFEVDPVGGTSEFAENLKAFLVNPHVTLILDDELVVIPSTSIRSISITRLTDQPDMDKLFTLPGVLTSVKRIVG
jgi:hypothetical protein